MDQQPEGMLEHLNRFGIAQRSAMQPCQIVAQTSNFACDSRHVSLADKLSSGWNKAWIDGIAITHPEVTLPNRERVPQGSKGCGTVVAHDPTKNSRRKVIHCCPNP